MTIPSPLHDCIAKYELAWCKPEPDSRAVSPTEYMSEPLFMRIFALG